MRRIRRKEEGLLRFDYFEEKAQETIEAANALKGPKSEAVKRSLLSIVETLSDLAQDFDNDWFDHWTLTGIAVISNEQNLVSNAIRLLLDSSDRMFDVFKSQRKRQDFYPHMLALGRVAMAYRSHRPGALVATGDEKSETIVAVDSAAAKNQENTVQPKDTPKKRARTIQSKESEDNALLKTTNVINVVKGGDEEITTKRARSEEPKESEDTPLLPQTTGSLEMQPIKVEDSVLPETTTGIIVAVDDVEEKMKIEHPNKLDDAVLPEAMESLDVQPVKSEDAVLPETTDALETQPIKSEDTVLSETTDVISEEGEEKPVKSEEEKESKDAVLPETTEALEMQSIKTENPVILETTDALEMEPIKSEDTVLPETTNDMEVAEDGVEGKTKKESVLLETEALEMQPIKSEDAVLPETTEALEMQLIRTENPVLHETTDSLEMEPIKSEDTVLLETTNDMEHVEDGVKEKTKKDSVLLETTEALELQPIKSEDAVLPETTSDKTFDGAEAKTKKRAMIEEPNDSEDMLLPETNDKEVAEDGVKEKMKKRARIEQPEENKDTVLPESESLESVGPPMLMEEEPKEEEAVKNENDPSSSNMSTKENNLDDETESAPALVPPIPVVIIEKAKDGKPQRKCFLCGHLFLLGDNFAYSPKLPNDAATFFNKFKLSPLQRAQVDCYSNMLTHVKICAVHTMAVNLPKRPRSSAPRAQNANNENVAAHDSSVETKEE